MCVGGRRVGGGVLIVKKRNHFLPISPHNRGRRRRHCGWQIIMRPQISIDEGAEAFFNKQSVDKLDWQQIQSAQRQSEEGGGVGVDEGGCFKI